MRRKLVRDLLLVFLLVAGAILAVALAAGTRVTSRASASLIETRTRAAQKEIDTYLEAVQKNLLIARKWGQSGLLSLEDTAALNAKFMPILEEMPEICGVMITHEDGASYYLRRDGTEWLTRTVAPEDARGTGRWQRWDESGGLLATWRDASSYDPRKRAWFRGAGELQGTDRVFWTRPYLFFSLDVPGVTVSAAWQEPGGPGHRSVIGFDVLLDDIYELLSGLRPRPGGSAFLFTDNGWVFTPNRPEPPDAAAADPDTRTYLTEAAAIGPEVSGAVERWKQEGRLGPAPVDYLVQGRRWWAGFSPLTEEGGGLWLGIIAPEGELLGQTVWSRSAAALLVALILGMGIAATAMLVRKHGRPAPVDAPGPAPAPDAPAREILNLIRQGEGHTLEFKSTLRMNLKTGKPEKGIELAWLKAACAFLNTDGGTLLIGVDDQGNVHGIEADAFDSDDRCRLHFKNLIAEHIGLEHSGALRMDVLEVEGRKVLRVECQRCPKPVFLTQGREESFYIRSGPSSTKLTLSKVLQYLQNRQ